MVKDILSYLFSNFWIEFRWVIVKVSRKNIFYTLQLIESLKIHKQLKNSLGVVKKKYYNIKLNIIE